MTNFTNIHSFILNRQLLGYPLPTITLTLIYKFQNFISLKRFQNLQRLEHFFAVWLNNTRIWDTSAPHMEKVKLFEVYEQTLQLLANLGGLFGSSEWCHHVTWLNSCDYSSKWSLIFVLLHYIQVNMSLQNKVFVGI